MKFKASEVAMMAFAVRTQQTNQGVQPRTFGIDDLKNAMEVFDKLLACSEGEGTEKKFIDGDIDMTVSDKSLILRLLERPWGIDEGKLYFEIKSKLNK